MASDADVAEVFFAIEKPYTSAPTPRFTNISNALLELYPDDPALGCPFGTGNETFGLSSQYKRSAAMVGDFKFHATRRAWVRAAARAGVRTFGYLFTNQKAVTNPSKGSEYSRLAVRLGCADGRGQLRMGRSSRTCTGRH